MCKFINEFKWIIVLGLLLVSFPHFVLAQSSNLDSIIDARIAEMTLEEKVGQLFIVGFPHKTVGNDLDRFIANYKPGSFLLFKRNIASLKQVRNLNEQLYRLSFKHTRLPPLIAIDQEGGAVSRLPISPAPPNALAIGQTQSPLLAEEIAYQTGLFLREVGFNMNLAPVLDVADPFQTNFIGVRSFGSEPTIVSQLGLAYSKGLLRANVIPTAKHFPGTGNLIADPHHNLVVNPSKLADLTQRDVPPFAAYSELGSNTAIMMSHLSYPALDDSNEPASFSAKISKNLLREQLKFKGLVLTDDLQMQGSRQLLRPEAGALKALKAGSDIVMLTWSFRDQGRAFDHVKNAVKKGLLTKEELDQKLKNILRAKAFANLHRRDPAMPSLLVGNSLTSKNYVSLEKQILDHNLKNNLQKNPTFTVSLVRSVAQSNQLCLISPSAEFSSSFLATTRVPTKSKVLRGSFEASKIKQWLKSQSCTKIIAAVTGPKTARLLNSLAAKTKSETIVVNLAAPKYFPKEDDYFRVIQLYFNHDSAGTKIAEYLDQILADGSIESVTAK